MPKVTLETRFYEFAQNNTYGRFVVDDATGVGHRVIIEATSQADAMARAEKIGLYFDGIVNGNDCPCCGDRWYKPDVHDELDNEYVESNWLHHNDIVFLHHYDGTFEQIKSAS